MDENKDWTQPKRILDIVLTLATGVQLTLNTLF